jgi:hypothetical protein
MLSGNLFNDLSSSMITKSAFEFVRELNQSKISALRFKSARFSGKREMRSTFRPLNSKILCQLAMLYFDLCDVVSNIFAPVKEIIFCNALTALLSKAGNPSFRNSGLLQEFAGTITPSISNKINMIPPGGFHFWKAFLIFTFTLLLPAFVDRSYRLIHIHLWHDLDV